MGSRLCDIQLIRPQTTPWKRLGRFVPCLLCFFTLASHKPCSGEALKLWCAGVYLLLVPWPAGAFSWKTQQQALDVHRVRGLIVFFIMRGQPWQRASGNVHLATAALLALPVPLREFFWLDFFPFYLCPDHPRPCRVTGPP